jgi:hypothetical protein
VLRSREPGFGGVARVADLRVYPLDHKGNAQRFGIPDRVWIPIEDLEQVQGWIVTYLSVVAGLVRSGFAFEQRFPRTFDPLDPRIQMALESTNPPLLSVAASTLVFPVPGIDDFIRHGFLTTDQREQRANNRRTFLTAIIAILIAAAVQLVAAVWIPTDIVVSEGSARLPVDVVSPFVHDTLVIREVIVWPPQRDSAR